jgi:hypothetical protein
MSDWTEKRKEQEARYDAAVTEFHAARADHALVADEVQQAEIRIRGEVYGDGSEWTSHQDPRINARLIEYPQWIELSERLQRAWMRVNAAQQELSLAQPKHFYGD